jgi:peptidoglycan hydrolase-like protein with peptidoglycan-binding domain
MATKAQINSFIAEIAPHAQEAFKKLGKVHPSVCIAMACVESAYGTSSKMRSHNAFLGQKVGTGKTATKYWDGTFFKTKTNEEYTIGQHTVIVDAFRSYSSARQCILNYYELLNSPLYKKVTATASPKIQMLQIKAVGYMTSSTEVNTVLKLIDKYNLTKYDYQDASQICIYDEPTKVIKLGSKGDGVRWVQWMLCAAGYEVAIDGIFGDKTHNTVINFQVDKYLDADGIVGKYTREALKTAKYVH